MRPLLLCCCALLTGCGESTLTTPIPASLLSDVPIGEGLVMEAPMRADSSQTVPERLFISGHSLVDQPFPDHLAAISGRAGRPLRWGRLYKEGSSIKDRSPPQMLDGPYDALLVTEQHAVLDSLVWHDTGRYLLEWHEALLAENPRGVTFFFVPWFSIDDKQSPERWVAYEKAAGHVWQCAISRVNAEIASTGRPDRIVTIPASLALTFLVERILAGDVLPGITQGSVGESLDLLISDNVHLTSLGSFYMALLTHLAMYQAHPESLERLLDAPPVPGVTAEQSRTLLQVATSFSASRMAGQQALTIEACASYLAEGSFVDDFLRYVRTVQQPDANPLVARVRNWRHRRQMVQFFEGWIPAVEQAQ